jgi:hypothetical protein
LINFAKAVEVLASRLDEKQAIEALKIISFAAVKNLDTDAVLPLSNLLTILSPKLTKPQPVLDALLGQIRGITQPKDVMVYAKAIASLPLKLTEDQVGTVLDAIGKAKLDRTRENDCLAVAISILELAPSMNGAKPIAL